MTEAYDGRQVVGMDLHRRRSVLVPGDGVPGLYLHPDHRRRLRRDPVRSDLNV